MNGLLKFSQGVDALNAWVGRWLSWLVLLMVLISAGNAIVRKVFSNSSNAFLEIQWYLFAAIFLLASAYTLLRNEHVKIDVVLGRFPRRTQVKVEIFGLLVFLLPFVVYVSALSWPEVHKAFVSGEVSENAGGLIRWPVYALLPVGMALLGLQGLSEVVKRLAFLAGRAPDPSARQQAKTAEEELAEAIRKQSGSAA
ncbi:TRAP transporter small permease subunit [Inhella proteolytica]|uniref:TRAP transporter small permease protein n=1 Tax=Inhella proteolytica TaxID=2795029 RepID=A0A931J0X0_9BURK|nr:TRAP transporter small permease subunit [Inhella proteolytica]MBH9575504.1 TRAP transporter small permease subunit [Inhella proteolytica]